MHIPFCAKVCFYCGCTKVVTRNRARGVEYLKRLLQEVPRRAALHGRQRGVRQLHLGGGTPTFRAVDQLAELLDTLRGLGFNRISLGIQDFDPRVQVAVNRVQRESATVAVVAAAREAGFGSISFDLIYALPLQSLESFGRTIAKAIALRPNRLSLFNYAHHPHWG